MPSFIVPEPVPEGRDRCCLATRVLLVLVPTSDQVLDVQDGGSQLLLQALLWGYTQE